MITLKVLARLRASPKIQFSSIDFVKLLKGRSPTWSFQKGLRTSTCCQKKRKDKEEKKARNAIIYNPVSKHKHNEVIDVWKDMTVKELAVQLGKDVDHVFDVMDYVKNSDKYTRSDSVISDFKVIEEVVKKSGFRFKFGTKIESLQVEEKLSDIGRRDKSTYKEVKPRPPVVTVMGHVDHGKTTLLDTLRHTRVVDQEFGGITQHIGAFSMLINGKDRITFLDTPGHAAFCSMRSRGAHCTDMVILVVAAEDGVMEQTVESIRMAQEAGVPIVVAINKIDKPAADVEATEKALLVAGVQVESSGGDVQVVPISALKGTNVDTLMEAVLVQAELLQLTTDYSGTVEAVVIESTTDPHRGKLCTILIQVGTLKKGAFLVAGEAWCKVRAIFDDAGNPLPQAPPSMPVQITGWRELPSAGDVVLEVGSERKAHEVVSHRMAEKMKEKMEGDKAEIEAKMEEHHKKYREQLEAKRKLGRFRVKPEGPRKKEVEDDGSPRLRILIKGDVNGSVEAVLDVLETYNDPRCELDVVHYGVGPVTHNDLILAETFKSIIYTFNTEVLKDVKAEADSKNVDIRSHNVIYKLVDELKSDINKLLPLKDIEEVVGEANVMQEFLINEGKRKIPVAGCRCTKGLLKKALPFKLLRREEVLFDGHLVSLRHLKDEVDTVKKDLECGVRLEDQDLRLQPGDTIRCYEKKKVMQRIDWDPGF